MIKIVFQKFSLSKTLLFNKKYRLIIIIKVELLNNWEFGIPPILYACVHWILLCPSLVDMNYVIANWKTSLLEGLFDRIQILLFTWANFYENHLPYPALLLFELQSQLQIKVVLFLESIPKISWKYFFKSCKNRWEGLTRSDSTSATFFCSSYM